MKLEISGIKDIEPLESKARCGEAYQMQVKIDGKYVPCEVFLNHKFTPETIEASKLEEMIPANVRFEKKTSPNGTIPWDYSKCSIESPVIFAISPSYNGQMTKFFKEAFEYAFTQLKPQESETQ